MSYQLSAVANSRVVARYDLTQSNEVELVGWHTPRGAKIVSENDQMVAIKIAGYTENPGSRNSGIRRYYSPETVICLKGELLDNGRWVYPIGDINHSRNK